MKFLAGVLIAGAMSMGVAHADEWVFHPQYDLPRRAAILPAKPYQGPAIAPPLAPGSSFFGMTPTDSRQLMAAAPSGDMTAELWIVDHVNQPVGVLLSIGGARLGYTDGRAVFGPGGGQTTELAERGYKGNWRHLVLVRSKDTWTLYENGQKAGETHGTLRNAGVVRIDAYLGAEKFMELGNLVYAASVEARAFKPEEVASRFAARSKLVDEGILYADRFHFTQPPYLNTPLMTSMDVSFEFDREASATIEYGEEADTMKRIDLPGNKRDHGATLQGLKADTPYFYRVTGVDASGARIDSGILSFRTAPPAGRPFVFAVTGDTEGRPHVNNALSQLMWQDRPNLLLIAGDLTDGGDAERRFEWTHEYFSGMGPFFGRVPTLAAPGNGESELKWYRHYHRHPQQENYFSTVYGDIEFFVIDSNLGDREKGDPGFRARQKAWLEAALKKSTARWKIAIHHHDVRTSDDDDYGDTFREASTYGDADVQADLLPLYEAYKMDVVFFAHLHTYERSWPIRDGKVDLRNGVTYVQVGGAGGNLEDFAPNKPWFSRKTFRNHHYVSVAVTPEKLEFQAIDVDGNLRDTFAIEKQKN